MLTKVKIFSKLNVKLYLVNVLCLRESLTAVKPPRINEAGRTAASVCFTASLGICWAFGVGVLQFGERQPVELVKSPHATTGSIVYCLLYVAYVLF